jgi:carbon storage regulator CsrA
MLVLSRKVNEEIIIAGNIRVTVVSIRGNQVRLGFTAPKDVSIQRSELTAFDEPVVGNSSDSGTRLNSPRAQEKLRACLAGADEDVVVK